MGRTTMIAVDLFAGCGGLSKGFENAGFRIAAAFENWPAAAQCYAQNFDHPVFQLDLNDVDAAVEAIAAYAPDIIIGGPPCQDFSHAGKRVEAGRACLTESYANIVKKVRPRFFLMENVDRAQKSHAYATARRIFKESGYGLSERVLLASRCGVPQRRKRFFCIGVLGGEDGALNAYLEAGLSDREMTVRDYLGDTLDTEFYYRHPRNYSRRGVFSIDEPAPTMRGVNRPIPAGYPGHSKDACPVSGAVRPLTTLERSLIQTFPADYKWTGSKTDREQMVGNAVPVNLAAYVAGCIAAYAVDMQKTAVHDNIKPFCIWLEGEKGYSPVRVKDTRSRLRRAEEMLPVEGAGEPEVYIARLESTDAFSALSPSVKSQIRGALRLYGEFSKTGV